MERVECIVIGAGVIGLAVARALARKGREVVILEANSAIGSETSSRNNEVIHAGFLYPTGSLKARLCGRGRDVLYRYCRERGIKHRRIGKLLIATSEEEASALRELERQAPNFGVSDLRVLTRQQAREIEPNLQCAAALYSPSSGILDAHSLLVSLLADAEAAGAVIARETRVTSVSIGGHSHCVRTTNSRSERYDLACRTLVNAAGLGARDIAADCINGRVRDIPPIDFAKGNFFSLSGPLPFQHLIVPIGDTLSAGGAFTIDIGGQGKFGPDLEWIDHIDYSVDEHRKLKIAAAVRRYFPDLRKTCFNRAMPAYGRGCGHRRARCRTGSFWDRVSMGSQVSSICWDSIHQG